MAREQENDATAGIVTGDEIEPDESRMPAEFAREEYLTVEQVAKACGCSTVQVREWLASGLLSAQRSGSIERIKRSELNRLRNP